MKSGFLVRLESNKQNQMKKSIHNQTSFSQISLEIVSRSNALMVLFTFFQKLKRHFKVQRLNDFLFAFKMNLKKKT